MSRFFATGGSDSESDSSSEEEQVVHRPAAATFTVTHHIFNTVNLNFTPFTSVPF